MGLMVRLGVLNTLKRKKQLILIIICMSIGLSLITTMIVFGIHTLGVLNSYTQVNFYSNYISVLSRNGQQLTDFDLEMLKQTKGIQMVCKDAGLTYDIEGEEHMGGTLYGVNLEEFPYADLVGEEGVVIPDFYYSNASEEAILVDTTEAIDDSGNLNFNLCNLEGGLTGKVVGNYHYTYNSLSGDSTECEVYISNDLFEQAEQFVKEKYGIEELSICYILYVDPKYDISQICEKLVKDGYEAGCYDGSTDSFKGFFSMLSEMLGIVGGVILVLSAWLTIRELTFNLERRKKNIGIMKAFGYRNAKIMTMIITEISIYCLAASVMAVPVSMILLGRLGRLDDTLIVPMNFGYVLATIGTSLLVAVIIGAIATLKTNIYCQKMNALEILKKE